jgi:serine/threonine protein phosphatase PrpC
VSNLIDGLLLLDGAFEPDSQAADVGGGSVIAFTERAPDKDTENEDTLAIIPWGPESVVMVVADGAGGLPAGKRASLTAVSSLVEALSVAMSETVALRTAILDGIEAANEAVMRLSNGSATTMTVVTIEGRIARCYQIGDSEALVVGQRGRIKLQTTAHSPTGFAVEAGFLDEREALHHAERHLVSNFLGTSDMKIDIGGRCRECRRGSRARADAGEQQQRAVQARRSVTHPVQKAAAGASQFPWQLVNCKGLTL